MTIKQSQLTAESLGPVIVNSKVTTDELLLVASILKRIAINNKYEQLDAHWVGTPAFDEMGNGQSHTEEWQQWSRASTFVDEVDTVASALYAYLAQDLICACGHMPDQHSKYFKQRPCDECSCPDVMHGDPAPWPPRTA